MGLNFRQEAREADLRYGLVRVRENAESIAFYDGAASEAALVRARLALVVRNNLEVLTASRNLDFFQSAYRYVIVLLPAAVVARALLGWESRDGCTGEAHRPALAAQPRPQLPTPDSRPSALYFRGEIEFGVVNQSQSAFSHILGDVSLIVYQFESLAGFSAVVDRLGQFQEGVEARGRLRLPGSLPAAPVLDPDSEIALHDATGAA